MGRRWWVGVVTLVLLTGCDAPTRPEHTTRIVSLAVTGTMQPNGDVAMKAVIDYPGDDGGPLRLGAPTLGTVTDVTLDGSPRSGSSEYVDLDPDGRSHTVEWVVHGAVERYVDGAIVTIPVWTPPRGLSGDDTRVPVTIEMHVAQPPIGAFRWHGARIAGPVEGDPQDIVYRGDIATTTASEITFLTSADAVPTAPLLAGASRVASYDSRQAPLDDADAHIATDIRNDKRREDVIADGYWGAVGLEIAIPFLITLIVLLRTAEVRRRASRDVPDKVGDPPSDLAPAVVSLLQSEGHDIGAAAEAATILDLAQRHAVVIESVAGERYTLKVSGASSRLGEAALLATLGQAGAIVGPPLPVKREGDWWRALRRDVVATARNGGLLRRRYPSGLFLTAVVALAITTVPLYARSPEALVGGVVVATILATIPFVGGYVLTAAGHRERAQWEAYCKHLREADLGDVPAAGVIVWETALVYAAALGIATTAIGDLS